MQVIHSPTQRPFRSTNQTTKWWSNSKMAAKNMEQTLKINILGVFPAIDLNLSDSESQNPLLYDSMETLIFFFLKINLKEKSRKIFVS